MTDHYADAGSAAASLTNKNDAVPTSPENDRAD